MDLNNKIKNALTEPNVKLLCQIPISDEEYKVLITYSRNKISNLYMQTIVPADILLAVTLVQIAIRSYSEGNYWSYFSDELQMDVASSRANYVGQMFVSTLKRYRLFELEREPGAKYAYVENIKAHSFAPNNYLDGYFDFLFSFYDRNLLRQLSDDIFEDISEMTDFFASTRNVSGDSIKLENLDNKPAKSYRLLKATRDTFAQCDPTVISQIMLDHLHMIDDFYYDEIIPESKDRFGTAFCKWAKSVNDISDNKRKGNKRRTGVFYHKPYFSIDWKQGTAYLVIPEQKIRNNDFNGNAFALVYIEGELRKYSLSIYRAFGVLVSEQIKVQIEDIFAPIVVTISSGTDHIFNIPEHDYRIFDDEYFELQKLRKGENYLLVRKGCEIRGYDPVYTNNNYSHWDEYSFADVDEKTVIYIDNHPISIAGSYVDGPIFEHVSKEYLLFENGKQIQTAFRHPTICFKVSKTSFDSAFIWCNNSRYQVERIATSFVDLPDDIDNYGVTVILEDIINNNFGSYRIIIDEPRKQKREICDYVLIPKLRCHPEKPRFIFANDALISIQSEYKLNPINCEQINESEFLLDISNGVEAAEFTLNSNEKEYLVQVPIKIFKHGFERVWQYSRPDYLWHTELKNDLYISMPGAIEAKVSMNSRSVGDIKIPGTALGDGIFRFDISQIVHKIRSSEQPYNYITIDYRDNQWRRLSLYRVLNRLFIERANVCFNDNNQVSVDIGYEGDDDLVLRFCDSISGEVVVEKTVINGKNLFPELSPSGLYNMHMFAVEPDPFGFSQKMTEIGHAKLRIGAINFSDLSNCKIMIKKIIKDGKPLKLDYTYALFNLQMKNENLYLASLTEQHIQTNFGPKYTPVKLTDAALADCLMVDGNMNLIALKSESEEGFGELYYDTLQKKLLSFDDDVLYLSHDITRYIPLYDDCTDFLVDIRRVR